MPVRCTCYTRAVLLSWYASARKRVALVALLLAVGLLVRDTCRRQALEPVTLRFELGPHAARLRALSVEVVAGGEVVGRLQRGAEGAGLGAPELRLPLPDGEAELRLELELAPAPPSTEVLRKRLRRAVHAEHGAVVTVPLGDELATP